MAGGERRGSRGPDASSRPGTEAGARELNGTEQMRPQALRRGCPVPAQRRKAARGPCPPARRGRNAFLPRGGDHTILENKVLLWIFPFLVLVYAQNRQILLRMSEKNVLK